MTLTELAYQIRPLIEKAAASLDDTDAVEAPILFPVWSSDEHYLVGDRRRFKGVLYKCL